MNKATLQIGHDHALRLAADCLDKRDYQAALSHLLQAVKASPTDLQVLDKMATCYWNLADHDTAIKLVEFVANDLGSSATAWGKLGAMALSVGEEEKARSAFEKTVQLAPNDARALAALNRLTVFKRNSKHAKALKTIAWDAKADKGKRAAAFNALGRVEEAAGNTKAAFINFTKAKALSPGQFDADALNAHVTSQIERFHPDPGWTLPCSEMPCVVFIVGMPRSGTTLVESILTRHEQVDTIGERDSLQSVLNRYRAHIGSTDDWGWVNRLTAEDAVALQKRYIAECARLFPTGLPPVIVDKTPLNIFELGFASRILPNAKFVFMSRHPLDVGLSNYVTNFFAAQPFSKTLDGIGAMTRTVYRSADDYQRKLEDRFLRQSYKEMVLSPDAQIRALLDHLELDWDASCLSPEKRAGIIKTASLTQVRAPIGASGLAKWECYKTELAPLIAALGGWEWIKEWENQDQSGAV